MKRTLPLLLLFFCVSLLAAENTGYRIVHPDGTVEFTDDATRGGEEIKLRDVQIVKTPSDEGEVGPRERPPEEEDKAPGYTSLRILSPQAEATVWFSEAGVTVAVAADPPLKPDDTVVLYLDGSAVAQGKSTSLNIGLVNRGTHSLSASIDDATGKTVISSPSVTFFLRQHSN